MLNPKQKFIKLNLELNKFISFKNVTQNCQKIDKILCFILMKLYD